MCPGRGREGIFVQYGIDFFEEPRDGTGLYTSAIVEMPDGRVRSVPSHLIRFWKEEEEEKVNETPMKKKRGGKREPNE